MSRNSYCSALFSFVGLNPGPARWRVAGVTRFLFAALLSLGYASAASAAAEPWIEVRTKHLSVITNAGESRGREVARRLEQYRAAFQVVFLKLKVSNPLPLQVFAFRNDKIMKQVVPLWKGKPVDDSGFFVAGEDRNYIALDLSGLSAWPVVIHEYMHLLINSNLPPTPAWFDEGIAEYYSTLRFENERMYYGGPIEGGVRALNESRWMRCVDLFSVGHDSPEYNERDRRSIFYAQSWLVVHYFMNQQKMAQVTKYLDLTQLQHRPVAEAIEAAFGMTPEKFDQELLRYFRGNAQEFFLPAPAEVDNGSYEVMQLDDISAMARLADMKYYIRDRQQDALAEFRSILEKDPRNMLANRGMGYASLRANDLETAGRYFQQAIDSGTEDARVYYYMALVRMRRGALLSDEQSIAYLERAIALDPTFADAYSSLGVALAMKGDAELGKKHAAHAVELSPRNDTFLMNFAVVLMHLHEWQAAEENFKRLQQSRNPQVAAAARSNLENLEKMRSYEQRTSVPPVLESEQRPGPPAPTAVEPAKPAQAEARPILFLKGVLQFVDCNNDEATLHILVGTKQWALRVKSIFSVLLIGEDHFSCQWAMRKVAVNYRALGENTGDVVSLEPQ